jgi:histidinol dehydrogenase
MKKIEARDAALAFVRELEASRLSSAEETRSVVRAIIDDVRRDGDAAVSRSLEKFDRVTIASDRIAIDVAALAEERIDPEVSGAIETAIARIENFHERQRQGGYEYLAGTSRYEHRVRPLRRAGIYVPGGRAVYLSTLIMCAIPARVAGVPSLVIATTPRAAARPELRYTCRRLGIETIYQCGGAAGVAALALGTASLERVDKIVGPGNSFVTQAKSFLLGEVGIDMTAGPTEVVVIGDDSTDPALAASDLLAQAEHGEDSAVILVTTSALLANAVAARIDERLRGPNAETAAVSIANHGAIILLATIDDCVEITNRIGPEHVEVQTRDADAVAARVDDCGAIFVGGETPVAAGDYIAGPNHVLPTGGAARFFSPLGVYDFYKRSNLVRLAATEIGEIGASAALLARLEGLPLHAESVEMRLRGVPASEVEVLRR